MHGGTSRGLLMQQSAQCSGAKTFWVGLPSFRKLKDILGDIIGEGIDLVLELKRFARHPISRADGFPDLRLETVYQAPRTPKVTHLRSPTLPANLVFVDSLNFPGPVVID